MAISSAICSSFKQELLQGKHSFESSGGHTFKLALFTSSASLGAATTDYSTSHEISNTSGSAYTAGGATLTNSGVSLSSTTAFTDFSDVTYTSASFTANGAMIYNTTTNGGSSTTDAVAIIAFAPVPNTTYRYRVHFNKMPDLLEGDNVNYISMNFSNGLLYCCLSEAYGFLKGPIDMLTLYENKYKQEVEKFASEQIGRRRRDDYTDGTIRIPLPSRTP